MKITIETDGKEPLVIEEVLGYELIVTTADETRTFGEAVNGIGLGRTMTMALAIEKLSRKFEPFNKMRKAFENFSDKGNEDS